MGFSKNDPNIDKRGRVGPNKSTKLMKEAFAMLVENNLPNLNIWISQIASEDPAKAMDLIIKLSERFVPALARTEVTGADGSDIFKELKFGFGPPIDSALRIQEDHEGGDSAIDHMAPKG
tara:strand:+ start:1292 stop:1651 length:360 start_codon:yes stop_codon:yes gene_type:complete